MRNPGDTSNEPPGVGPASVASEIEELAAVFAAIRDGEVRRRIVALARVLAERGAGCHTPTQPSPIEGEGS